MRFTIYLLLVWITIPYCIGQVTFEKVIDEGYSELTDCIRQCDDQGYIISG